VKPSFKDALTAFQSKMLRTEVSRRRRLVSAVFSLAFCLFPFVPYFLIMQNLSGDGQRFYTNLLLFAGFWLLSELVIIWHLFHSSSTPQYLREALNFTIVMSNLWFLFFILYSSLHFSTQ